MWNCDMQLSMGQLQWLPLWQWVQCKSTVFTVRLHVMQCTVLLSQFRLSICLSVRLSVTRVYCDKTKWCTADILIPHETAITLVFWYQHWLVGDAPSLPLPSNIRQKWPTPVQNWSFHVTSISCAFGRWRFGRVILARHMATTSHPEQNHWQCWQLHSGLFVHRQSHCLSAIPELLVDFRCLASKAPVCSIIDTCLSARHAVHMCRDTRWSAGHGVRHVHQDLIQVSPPLCPGADWWSDAVHWRDSEFNQHHHLWSPTTAGLYHTVSLVDSRVYVQPPLLVSILV